MNTQKLFEIDSHMIEFDATVLSCEKIGKNYAIVLDKTAFFPNGGGQPSDTGYIGDIEVIDVQIVEGNILHFSSSPIRLKEVHCKINWPERFRRMQNHSGEHIFSGIIHKMTGFDNVGFHMSEHSMTVDFSVEIPEEQLKKAEYEANSAIYKNLPVISYYPSSQERKNMDYRSKLELKNDVRIVEIEGIDCCACCAPHVKRTGEIGIIKVLSHMRHRGGTRVFLTCGRDAFNDYSEKNDSAQNIGELLSAKKSDIYDAVKKLNEDLLSARYEISCLKQKYASCIANGIQKSQNNIYIFEEELCIEDLRLIVNECREKTDKIILAFSGNDVSGYRYVIYSKNFDVLKIAKELNQNFNGKGGGKNGMIMGNLFADKSQIISFFDQAIAMSAYR